MSDQTLKKDDTKESNDSVSTSSSPSTAIFTPEETPIRTPALTQPSTFGTATLPNGSNFPPASISDTPAQNTTTHPRRPSSALDPSSPDYQERRASFVIPSMTETSHHNPQGQEATNLQAHIPRPYGTRHPGLYMAPSFDQTAYGAYPSAYAGAGGNPGGLGFGPPVTTTGDMGPPPPNVGPPSGASLSFGLSGIPRLGCVLKSSPAPSGMPNTTPPSASTAENSASTPTAAALDTPCNVIAACSTPPTSDA